MGLVLDSTVFINGERCDLTVLDILQSIRETTGDEDVVISVITAAELVHGVWRAQSPEAHARRLDFVELIFASVPVKPITLPIVRIAGRVDADCRAKGITIPTGDLFIAVTALDLGFAVGTHNLRHFRLIPKLRVHRLQ